MSVTGIQHTPDSDRLVGLKIKSLGEAPIFGRQPECFGLARLPGHFSQSLCYRVVNLGKFSNANHMKNLLEMVRDAGNTDNLVIFFGLGQNLYQHSNPTAVDIRVLIYIQQYPGRTISGCLLVGFIEEWLRKCGNVSLNFHDRHSAAVLKLNLVTVLHLNLRFLLPPDLPFSVNGVYHFTAG